ncbi:MAG: apolipoprotein N-acyltransferase [Caulobacteraceae bacterium]
MIQRQGGALGPRQGLGLACAGGLAAALAHPPFGLWAGIFGFALLQFSLDRTPQRHALRTAFLRGWAAGSGYLLISTWWVAEAFFVDAANHGWQAPLAVLFTAGGIGLFWGAAGLVYRLIAPSGPQRILVFAAVLSTFEWLRGHVLTGFPWDLPGEAWRAGSAPSQAASLIGAYGMTFVTVAIGAAPVVLSDRNRLRSSAIALAAAALALAGLWGYGVVRLSSPPPPDASIRIRIVQPGLKEEPVWTDDLFRERFERFLRQSAWPAAHPPDVVIWPEGAIPAPFNAYLARGTWTEEELADAFQPGQTLLNGGFRFEGPEGQQKAYNSLLMLRRTQTGFRSLAVYDKYKLVPFGEYLPFPKLFSLLHLTSLVQNGEPFSPGPLPAPVGIPGVPRMQPLICYESLFPGFTSSKGGRPDWIVNVSDDAWFGQTTGPWQHLNLASYRAIEEGLPMVRATPTGVSAIVDAYGRVRAHLGMGRQGIIDSTLPGRLAPTPYSRLRELPFCVLLLIGFASTLMVNTSKL